MLSNEIKINVKNVEENLSELEDQSIEKLRNLRNIPICLFILGVVGTKRGQTELWNTLRLLTASVVYTSLRIFNLTKITF